MSFLDPGQGDPASPFSPQGLRSAIDALSRGAWQGLRFALVPGAIQQWAENRQTPPAPISTPALPGGPLNMPAVPGLARQRPVAGGEGVDLGFNIPDLPAPPVLPAPPRAPGVPMPNFGQVNQWLDKATPTPSGHIANVLGGFAQGAASSPAGAAPTFSQMLAQIGGGGAQGFQRSSKEHSEHFTNRAQFSQRQTEKTTDVQTTNAKIAAENARLAYEVQVKNEMAKYEYLLKKHELAMPKVQMTANGLLIQAPDPETGKMTVKFTPTKTQLENLENIKNVAAMMGIPGSISEAVVTQHLIQMYQGDPVGAQGAMTQLAIQQTIGRGAGSAVFGDFYKQAVTQATRALQQENPTLASRPVEFQQELNRRIAALIMQHPSILQDMRWLERAAQQGVTAAYVLQPRRQGQQQQVPGLTRTED